MPHDQRYNDFWAFLGKGTCICKHRRSLHCERWAVDSPCSQLRHWSESPSASLTVVRRAGCRGPCIYLSVDKHDAVRPQPPTRRWLAGCRGPCMWGRGPRVVLTCQIDRQKSPKNRSEKIASIHKYLAHVILQDLLQSCSRGGGRRVEDMCSEGGRGRA